MLRRVVIAIVVLVGLLFSDAFIGTVLGQRDGLHLGAALPQGDVPQPGYLLVVVPVVGQDWITIVAQRDFAIHVVSVAQCESRLDPRAIGDHGERGLLQIYLDGATLPLIRQLGYTPEDLFDPRVNLYVAQAYWGRVGWRSWTCARRMGLQ